MEQSNNELSLTGLKECTLFLKIGALGLRDGWFVDVRPQVFSKAELAEYLTEDKRDRSCYLLIQKLIEQGILEEITLYRKSTTHYRVNPDKYKEHLEILTRKNELIRHAKTIFGERGL